MDTNIHLSVIVQQFRILLEHGPARGLNLSTLFTPGKSKSSVWCRSAADMGEELINLGIAPINNNGILHLGAPLGDEAFMRDAVADRVRKAGAVMDKLVSLKDPHCEFVLLRSCFSLPKVSYSLRTTPPTPALLDMWQIFDDHVRSTLSRILGSNLDDTSWLQATLPTSKCGLGLRIASSHASSAFLSSLTQ